MLAVLLGPALLQAGDPIFDQAKLHEVRIEMDPSDWAALQANYLDNQYYAANISLDSTVVQQVGVRSRGAGSRNAAKPGLKVDFNKYVSGQEFHGYKSLVIDNQVQDGSFLRERLAFKVFEAMGIPAPQNSFARLTVNGAYAGVYDLVEPVSKPFLKSRLGDDSGNLFDYEYADPYYFAYSGPDSAAYIPRPFQPETHEDDLDPSGFISSSA
jgi:spore coat protein CotH